MTCSGARKIEFIGKVITYYGCSDCGCVSGFKNNPTLRPNGKFCDVDCMAFVIRNKATIMKRLPVGAKSWLEEYKKENK